MEDAKMIDLYFAGNEAEASFPGRVLESEPSSCNTPPEQKEVFGRLIFTMRQI